MGEIKVSAVSFLFREELKPLGEAINLLPFFERKNLNSANDILDNFSPEHGTLVIASLVNKNDLIEIATFVKMAKKISKEISYKIIVINFSKNQAYEKAIENLGIKDLIEPGLNTKSFKFKLDIHYKAIASRLKRDPVQNNEKTFKNDHHSKEETTVNHGRQLLWDPPLELEDDMWILQNESDVKFIFSRWLVKLMGPGLFSGGWTEEKKGLWRFDFKPGEKAPFIQSEGIWFFKGEQRPEFDNNENLWLFTGEEFELFFSGETQNFIRAKCVKKELHVCKNSSHAKRKESAIKESLDKEITFTKEADKLQNMEGESSTETLNSGPLKGKTNNPSDKFNPLSGKITQEEKEETDEDFLDQLSSLNTDPLKGKTNNPSDKLNPLSGKIPQKDGKDKESKPDKSSGPSLLTSFLDGNLGLVGNKKEKEDKPHESQTGDPLDDFKIDIDDVQSGKLLDLEADIEYQKHYKKHNEAKKYGTVDLPQGGLGKDEDKNLPVDQLFRAEDEISDFKVSCLLIADGKKIECNLYDHFENFIIYLTQKVSIQESANVDVDISFSFKDYRVNIKVNGTVASIEDAGDGNIFICIKMKAEDLAKFESLMKQYKIMQQGVTKFIKKARGVA